MKKSSYGFWIFLFFVPIITGCAQIKTYKTLEQPINTPVYADVGGVVMKVRKTRDLPNMYGRADMWGGKVRLSYL